MKLVDARFRELKLRTQASQIFLAILTIGLLISSASDFGINDLIRPLEFFVVALFVVVGMTIGRQANNLGIAIDLLSDKGMPHLRLRRSVWSRLRSNCATTNLTSCLPPLSAVSEAATSCCNALA
jgi:hypothetical protein